MIIKSPLGAFPFPAAPGAPNLPPFASTLRTLVGAALAVLVVGGGMISHSNSRKCSSFIATPNRPFVLSAICRHIFISAAREIMEVRIRCDTRSHKTWWMLTAPSGSAVDIDEKRTRISRDDVEGRWLHRGELS